MAIWKSRAAVVGAVPLLWNACSEPAPSGGATSSKSDVVDDFASAIDAALGLDDMPDTDGDSGVAAADTADLDTDMGTCRAAGCGCQNDDDCLSVPPNPCKGLLYCAPETHTCTHNAATAVVCPKDADPDDCRAPVCVPAKGACELVPLADGIACELDGSPCSADKCKGGACAPGAVKLPCPCTVDEECAAVDDGDVCTGVFYCDLAALQCMPNPATTVTCQAPSPGPCEKPACVAASGVCVLVAKPDDTPCDDGNPCTSGTFCASGLCVASSSTCACTKSADCKDDGNLCNGVPYCDVAAGKCHVNPVTVVECPPADPGSCSAPTCDPKTGKCNLQPLPDGTPCNDGSTCTTGDACKKGACTPAKSACQCKADKDCAAFEDGNLCNGTLYCDKAAGGVCKVSPKTVVTCPSAGGTVCAPIQCEPKSGKCLTTPLPDGAPCEADGFKCTPDTCSQGACKAGPMLCPCWTNADCAAKEDGDLCNGTLYCAKTQDPPQCAINPATVVVCEKPSDPCSTAACDPKTGKCALQPLPDGGECGAAKVCAGGQCVAGCGKPGVTCTAPQTCVAGKCVAQGKPCTKPADCDDKQACTADACDANVCANTPLAEGAACNDGLTCTVGEVCKAGKCKGTVNHAACKDGDECTDDYCVEGVGCKHGFLNPCGVFTCGAPGLQKKTCKGLCGGKAEECDCQPGCSAIGSCCFDMGVCCTK